MHNSANQITMGVDGLLKLAKTYAPNSIKEMTYADCAGQIWVVDASIFFYKFCHDPKKKKNNPHVDGFYKKIYRLYKHGIQPVIIFDGSTPAAKLNTVLRRKQAKNEKKEVVETLQKELIAIMGPEFHQISEIETLANLKKASAKDLEKMFRGHPREAELGSKVAEIIQASKNIISFQSTCYEDVQNLCDIMKVPTYRASGEADALCTKLCLQGKAQATMSEDSDILLYHGRKLICKSGWADDFQCIDLDLMLEGMGLNYLQFVDLCILCGTDYTVSTIDNLGPVGAYEHIKAGRTIEDILNGIAEWQSNPTEESAIYSKYSLPGEPEDFDYQAARDLILKAHESEPEINLPPPGRIAEIDVAKLSSLMMDKCRCRPATIPGHHKIMMDSVHLFHINSTQSNLSHHGPKLKVTLKAPIKLKIKVNLLSKSETRSSVSETCDKLPETAIS